MSAGTLLLNTQTRPEDPEKLLKQLLEYVQRCQKRFGGRSELATEFDSSVAGLCLCLEAVFLHGLKNKPSTNQKQVNSTLRQVSDIVAQSLHIRQESVAFWSFIEKHLTAHEQERFNILKHVWTDIGKCKAWLRAALNEKSLERYFHIVLSDKDILREHYESWALLRDEDKNSMLPNMAAGLGSILFAISIDKAEFNISIAPRPVSIKLQEEPIIEAPVPENKEKKKNHRVARQIISFDDDDSMLSTSVPSLSSSSTCSDSSSNGNQQNENNVDDKVANNEETKPNPKPIRKLSIENSGSRSKFSTVTPGTLTPINYVNNIGELTPVSVEHARDLSETFDNSDDILEVPTDISAVLTVVENKNLEEIRWRDERINLLSKENDALKDQLKKYVSAIQMLRRDDEGLNRALEGLQIESQPDYKGEAKIFEQKLVQVAEMHAELMDFNVMLQKSLHQKDVAIERLKRELEILKGPISVEEFESDESQGSVNVWIPSAFLTGSGSSAYHVYQIFLKVGNDEWNIYRRYAQFHALHSDLKKLDPAVRGFDFPPKKGIGNKDSALVEDRRKRLQLYLRRVIGHWPELSHCASRFLLEQHLAFFKDRQEDEANKNAFTSRRAGNTSNSAGL